MTLSNGFISVDSVPLMLPFYFLFVLFTEVNVDNVLPKLINMEKIAFPTSRNARIKMSYNSFSDAERCNYTADRLSISTI